MLRGLVRGLLRWRGYEVRRVRRGDLAFAEQRSLAGLLQQQEINLVLDVGANTGQFVSELRRNGYRGRILSFEPLSSAHELLCLQARSDPNWTIAERTAIGAETGSIEIHVSGNSVSSSILDLLPRHTEAAPQSTYIGTETVPIHRLDDLYKPSDADRVLLKIDVQGYERQVLEGAQSILSTSQAVMSEMSLMGLYEGQILARELWDLLTSRGFEIWSLEPSFRHPETGRTFQVDGMFVRSSPSPYGN
jgi:FkbM family methyltransferase